MKPPVKYKLFGTDGIRAPFGEYPLDGDSIVKLGRVLGELMQNASIIVGRDTRQSGIEITRLMAAGIAGRADLHDCGVVPTPGLSYITAHGDFDYGIMITASHNPWTDNGIKLFGAAGEKIPDELEQQVEERFHSLQTGEPPGAGVPPVELSEPSVTLDEGCKQGYLEFLHTQAARLDKEKTRSFKVLLDCANGATFEAAPAVFQGAGFDLTVIHHAPDGQNINRDCGSTALESLGRTVKTRGADLGVAFDGDGDRVLMVDSRGNTLDGDHILYLLAKFFTAVEKEFKPVVVGTVMGNLGLERALQQMGVTYTRSPVGDRNVYRDMKRRQAILGGEQSGHTILRHLQVTGDGILTALYFIRALFHFDVTPTEVFRQLRLYPQVLRNLRVKEKRPLEGWDTLERMIAQFNARHGANSRVLIRYSGTEPKIRVMIESEDASVIEESINKFEALIKSEIGE